MATFLEHRGPETANVQLFPRKYGLIVSKPLGSVKDFPNETAPTRKTFGNPAGRPVQDAVPTVRPARTGVDWKAEATAGGRACPALAKEVYLGVLAARSSSAHRPYQAQTTFFRRLVRESEALGVRVFIFSPRDVLWKKRRIRGWTWQSGAWRRKLYPFPAAVYDRVSRKGKVDLTGVKRVRARLRRLRIPLFNARFGGKWRMYRIFSKNPILREAIPPTRRLSRESLKAMIEKYGEVYVKPSNGGQGQGVAWAKRVRGGYVYQKNLVRRSVRGRASSLEALIKKLRARRRPYLVQMAVRIPRYKGRSFDLRALVQRGRDGEWRVTGIVARLGRPRSRVTNIHAGGSAAPVEEVLREIGAGDQQEMIVARASELALEVARAIANATKGYVAELGVDIALDDEWKCWVLEANSRTGRISFHKAGLAEAGAAADRGPAEFALYLAERKARRP